MADPVSWFLIERGWKVVDSEGAEVGAVDEVVGDSEDDIFNGLAISTRLLGKPRYVPAERVGTITEGRVQLTMPKHEIEHLGEYEEPATEAQILPEDASLAQRIEQRIEAPIHARPFPMNVWRRLWLRLRRRG
jgi:sporulation protein YlmC with PRC-barrel domain